MAKIKSQLLSNGVKQFRLLSKVFQKPNVPGNIELERQEFYAGLNELGVVLSKIEAEALFPALDTNGNYKISFDEFLNGIRKPLNEKRGGVIEQAFAKYDKSKNGFLEVPELKYGCYVGRYMMHQGIHW